MEIKSAAGEDLEGSEEQGRENVQNLTEYLKGRRLLVER